jgi:hypothetical protein
MRSIYVFLVFVILLILCNKCEAQLGVFKYGTFYTGIGLNNSLNEENTYTIQNNILTETSIDNKFNYRISYGFRRLARLNFELKGKNYTDGSETKWGMFRSSLLNGLEYNLSYEKVRDRGLAFSNSDYWLRYLGSFFQLKVQATNLEGIDLKYKQIDIRLKKEFNSFRFTLGGVYRFHNAYGINPFERDFSTSDDFLSVAEQLGYYSEYYFIDANNNLHLDREEQSFYRWFYNGNVIAETTSEFFKYQYSGIINRYNREEIELLGIQQTLSAVVGFNYYKYNDTYHTLLWCNVIPYNKPITDYGYNDGLDYEVGALVQKDITKNMAFYLEAVYLSYFNRENYTIKTGLNYIIK